jgi:hypothetical protein
MAVRRPGPPRWEGGFPESRICVDGLVEIVACFHPLSEWKVEVSSVKSICIPSLIETIDNCAFMKCRNLSVLTFESGCKVSRLGESAFENCSSLQSICIPSSIETISDRCFSNCTNLSILTFESCCKVSILGEYAFARCSSLQSICIPSSIETISYGCFSD